MTVMKFVHADETIESTAGEKPAFISAKSIDWTPWVIEGTKFKLFEIDPKTGGFTFLLHIEAGTVAPVHGHIGAVQGIITKGGFAYSDTSKGEAGDYVCEDGGIRHKPYTDVDTEIFAITHGPLIGYHPDGSLADVLSAKEMLEMARKAGQADHIDYVFDD